MAVGLSTVSRPYMLATLFPSPTTRSRKSSLATCLISFGIGACCQSTLQGFFAPDSPNLVFGLLVVLAYKVGLARAYSVMHASASSGRSRRDEAPLILISPTVAPRLSSVIRIYILAGSFEVQID